MAILDGFLMITEQALEGGRCEVRTSLRGKREMPGKAPDEERRRTEFISRRFRRRLRGRFPLPHFGISIAKEVYKACRLLLLE